MGPGGGFGRGRTGPAELDPAVDDFLRSLRVRQGTGRHIAAYHRAGARVRPVTDLDRGHERVVRSGPYVAAYHRMVLLHAVIVDENCGRPDVAVLPDRGVPHVRQMRHLGARTDLRVLGLDE